MEIQSKPRKPPPIDRRPTMLKDFLRDDLSSCSSSGFRSFPRRSRYSSVRTLLEMDLKAIDSKNPKKLPRSRTKSAIGTISAFQKASEAVINVVKHFQFPSPSKQGILPRSLSRKLKRSFTKRSDKDKREIRVIVKVIDIIKWRSFRDFVDGKDKTLDLSLSSSPIRTTTTTASNSNSWSDSDFASECLQSSSDSSEYSGENEIDEECKKYLPEKQKTNKITKVVEEDSMQKDESRDEDKDQFSPVSVLDFPFEEDEDRSSFSQSSLENMERTKHKLMQKIRRFESLAKLEPVNLDKRILSMESDNSLDCHSDSYSSFVNNNEVETDQEEDGGYIKAEEQARELLKIIKKNSSEENCIGRADRLLVDFLRDEIMQRNQSKKAMKEREDKELLKVATDWVNGNVVLLDWGLEESRGVYYKEIEKGGGWSQFEEENGEIVSQMETEVYNSLMDELLLDFLCWSDNYR